MKERVQGCVTVGVAMVGVGALALAPMAPQPDLQVRAAQVRTVDVPNMTLLAATTTATPTPPSLLGALQILGNGVLGPDGSVERLANSTVKALFAPLELALAAGDQEKTKAIIADFIDGPLYVADPTIFAIDKILPAPFGQDPAANPQFGNTSDVLKFRVDVLYALREAIKTTLGLQPAQASTDVARSAAEVAAPSRVGDPIYTVTRLAEGLGESGVRLLNSTVQALLAPVNLAMAFGNEAETKAIIANFIDGPLYVADPTIFAIDDVLPAPLGQDPAANPQLGHTSWVLSFRVNVLYALREAIKTTLGVQPTQTPAKDALDAPDVAAPVKPSLKLANALSAIEAKPKVDPAPSLKPAVGATTPSTVAATSKLDDVVSRAVAKSKAPADGDAAAAADGKGAADDGTTTKKPGAKHRAPTNNPVGSALKKLRHDAKKASQAKHAKAAKN